MRPPASKSILHSLVGLELEPGHRAFQLAGDAGQLGGGVASRHRDGPRRIRDREFRLSRDLPFEVREADGYHVRHG